MHPCFQVFSISFLVHHFLICPFFHTLCKCNYSRFSQFDTALALMTSLVILRQVALLSFSLAPAVKRKYVLSTLIKHAIFRPSAEMHLTQNAIRALSGLQTSTGGASCLLELHS